MSSYSGFRPATGRPPYPVHASLDRDIPIVEDASSAEAGVPRHHEAFDILESQPLSRRRRFSSSSPSTGLAVTAGAWFGFTWYAALLWFPIVWTLRIVIAVQLGWDGTSALYKASLITAFLLPPPIPEVLFIVDRSQVQDVRPIDLAYVCCSLVLAFVPSLISCVLVPVVAALATWKIRR